MIRWRGTVNTSFATDRKSCFIISDWKWKIKLNQVKSNRSKYWKDRVYETIQRAISSHVIHIFLSGCFTTMRIWWGKMNTLRPCIASNDTPIQIGRESQKFIYLLNWFCKWLFCMCAIYDPLLQIIGLIINILNNRKHLKERKKSNKTPNMNERMNEWPSWMSVSFLHHPRRCAEPNDNFFSPFFSFNFHWAKTMKKKNKDQTTDYSISRLKQRTQRGQEKDTDLINEIFPALRLIGV